MSCLIWTRGRVLRLAGGMAIALASNLPSAAQDAAGASSHPDLVAEFSTLRDQFWSDWTASQAASLAYWTEHRQWLAEHGSEFENEDAATAHYREAKGASPVDPLTTYVPRFRELLARAGSGEPAAEIRRLLLNIFGNARLLAEWTDVYLEIIARTPTDVAVGINARSATYVTVEAGRWAEVRTALLEVMDRHPQSASVPGIRFALAEKHHDDGDLVAARMLYQEVCEKHPGTQEVDMALAAIYEIDHLQPGMPAPAFEAMSVAGEAISIGALKGKVVLLDFWATWCGPCLKEMPTVISLRQRFSAEDLAVIGISLDHDQADLLAFLGEGQLPQSSRVLAGVVPHASVSWPQLCDSGGWGSELAKLYRVVMIPRTVLIDREGRIAHLDLRGDELMQATAKLVGP
jgi:thiol-disulfide isomerase/thioredoxin